MEGLQVRENRIAQLETRQIELTTRWESEIRERDNRSSELTLAQNSQAEELERLKLEVEQLRSELEEAKEASEQAEERCQDLERQLSDAEERAQSGQEARDASALEEAQRDAAEARTIADELRRRIGQMEAQRETGRVIVSERMQSLANEARQRRVDFAESFMQQTPDENALQLIKLQVSQGDGAAHNSLKAIAGGLPVDRVRLTCLSLWEKGYIELGERLAGHVGTERDLDSLLEFLNLVGARDVSRSASRLVRRTLNHFAWFRDSADIPQFMRTLRDNGWESWALQIHDECAIRRDPNTLAELLTRLGEQEASEMLISISDSRPTETVPPLLGQMKSLGLNTEVQEIMAALEMSRPADFKTVRSAWNLSIG
ncbi:hypothetical protein [Streptomyces sp. NPDC001893]|uniref:hypothetical protein n=1 Tax=Streptomyces sp. NPDC001893 TaxID=3154530 RepID=UPI00331B75D7